MLSAEHLSVGYDGRAVLEDLNFTVNKGDYLCVVGENGSGKSTLMKTLLGLIPPVSGNISRGDGFAAGEIGFLPQQTAVQRDFPAAVSEIGLSGFAAKLGLRPFYNKDEKERAAKIMQKLGITDIKDKCYRELSGGQQQRVLLARALCAAGSTILLDEPVTGLDPKTTTDLYTMISDLNKNGTTVIMISHDMQAAGKYSSHILHLGESQLFFGPTSEYAETDDGKRFLSGR